MRHALRFAVPFAGSCLTLTLLAGSTRADVLVVDATNGPFTTIQSAVDAAVGGDTILVKPGTYASFWIQSKALTLAGEGAVSVTGFSQVTGVPQGQRVVVSGLAITVPGSDADAAAGFAIAGNSGEVRVAACSVTGQMSLDAYPGGAGIRIIDNTGAVALVGCTITGGAGWSWGFGDQGFGGFGGTGLEIRGTRVALYDGIVRGGRGGNAHYGVGGRGGHAALSLPSAASSGLLACGTQFHGGRGGDSWEEIWDDLTQPGGGGDGLHVEAGTLSQLLDNEYVGGAPGVGIYCNPTWPPPPGVGIGGSGHTHTYPVTRVKLVAPNVARESTNVSLAVHGQPGEEVFLFSSRTTGFAVMPSWRGALIPTLRSPSLAMILGTIPASGVLDVSYEIPALPAGVPARDLYLQTWRRDGNGSVTLGSFAVVTVLDAIH